MNLRLPLPALLPLAVTVLATLIYTAGRLYQWQYAPEDYYRLTDPDVLLRLTLIYELLQGGSWHEHVVARMNSPFGLETPWTRPMDVLTLVCTAPFLIFLPAKTALVAGSFLYSSLLVFTFIWLAVRIVNLTGGFPAAGYLVALSLLFYPSLLQYMQPGNVDHHGLLILLSFITTYGVVLISRSPDDRWGGIWISVAVALGMWTSIEFQLVAGVVYAWFGWQWALSGHRRWLKQMSVSAACTGVLLILALLIEHPADRFLQVVYDSLSIVHISLIACVGIATGALYAASPFTRNITSRLLTAIFIAGISLLILLFSFPLLPKGPMALVSPAMKEAFLDDIMEMSSPFSFGILIGMAYIFYSLLCILYICRLRPLARPSSPYLHFLMLANLVFLILSVQAVRMACYAGPFSILLLVHLLHLRRQDPSSITKKPVLITLLAIAPFYIGTASDIVMPYVAPLFPSQNEAEDKTEEMSKCHQDLIRLTESGRLAQLLGPEPKTLLAYGNWGPYLLWRSPYSIIIANYHRNEHGYLDGLAVLHWTDAVKAVKILRERNVNALILCSEEINPGLVQMLEKQGIPGLSRVDVDGSVPKGSALRVYRVDPEALDGTRD